MSKGTCKHCGTEFYLKGKERWEISEAIKYLVEQHKNHKCTNDNRRQNRDNRKRI